MENLKHLLERFSRSLNKDTLIKDSVVDVIKRNTGVNLSQDKLSLKEGVLEINAGPAVKNEIRLKEGAIRSELNREYKVPVLRILYK